MNIFTKIKILVKTYFAQRSGIQLTVLLEAIIKILMLHAPQGKPRYKISVLPEGNTEVMEIEQAEKEISDKQSLEDDMGATYSNYLRHKAGRIIGEIPSHETDAKDLAERVNATKENQAGLLESTPDYHYYKRKYFGNKFAFLFFVLGETGAMSIIFADLFGLDPTKLSSEVYRHPISFLITLTLSISFFAATLKIAEQALYTKKKVWVAGLLFISLLIGGVRAIQASALGETDTNVLFLSLLFTTISFVLPLVAASFAIKSKEAGEIIHTVDSKFERLKEQEALYQKRLAEAEKKLQLAQGQLDGIVQEYVSHYQKWRSERAKLKADWERFIRYVEAYLNTIRLCYLFWSHWPSRERAVSRPIKRLAQITAVLLVAIMLLLIGRSTAHAGDKFNMVVLCDRSSSAAEYSCPASKLEEAGRVWVQKADDAGGGTFQVFLIDTGFDKTPFIFSESYPESFKGPVTANKRKWRVEFLHKLKAVNMPTGKGSAIAEAIKRSSLRIHNDGQTLFLILSDLREVNEAFNFEKVVPTEKEFISWLEANALMPKFNGTTRIVVSGMHPCTPDNKTSRMTAENYDWLFKLWQAVFKKWGVRATISEESDFGNYR